MSSSPAFWNSPPSRSTPTPRIALCRTRRRDTRRGRTLLGDGTQLPGVRAQVSQVARVRATGTGTRGEPVAEGLEVAGLEFGGEAHGGNPTEVWNAYHFPAADWSVELKFSTDPALPSIHVYDYAGRRYKNPNVEPLGLEWAASDQDIVDAFVERLQHILEQARNGARVG